MVFAFSASRKGLIFKIGKPGPFKYGAVTSISGPIDLPALMASRSAKSA